MLREIFIYIVPFVTFVASIFDLLHSVQFWNKIILVISFFILNEEDYILLTIRGNV